MNEYYGVATTPTTDYLAHYGVKGMKWGVRRALEKGGNALDRQYRKDARHLAKLEKRAISGKKYAKRAAALGAGAAAAGGLAAAGTLGAARGIGALGTAANKVATYGGYGMQMAGKGLNKLGLKKTGTAIGTLGLHTRTAGIKAQTGLETAGKAVQTWGGQKNIGESIAKGIDKVAGSKVVPGFKPGQQFILRTKGTQNLVDKAKGISNSGYARIGAAGVGAGLAAGAAYNAYRAATTKKAAAKANQFREQMNKAYAGTKYANGYRPVKKKRR